MAEFQAGAQPAVPAALREEALHPGTGFDFSNVHRNARIVHALSKNGQAGALPRAKLTGTTIVGCIYKDGIVLGADTRATSDTEVVDKNCDKIHYIAPNIYCCGAGTAADTQMTTENISSQLDLLRLSTGTESRVVTACTLLKRMLFRYQGHISAALVLGGVDSTGPHLYNVYPHGSSDKLPYLTMGSGSLAAMAMFETGYKEDMSEEEAVALVKEAILAGVFNDLGSGSNCDVCIIRSAAAAAAAGTPAVTKIRGAVTPNDVGLLRDAVTRPPALRVPAGATAVLHKSFVPLHKIVDITPAIEPMAL